MSIQTRTSLRRSARQVTMPHNLRFREQLMKTSQHIHDSFCLLRRASVAWLALLIQSTFVTDGDGATRCCSPSSSSPSRSRRSGRVLPSHHQVWRSIPRRFAWQPRQKSKARNSQGVQNKLFDPSSHPCSWFS